MLIMVVINIGLNYGYDRQNTKKSISMLSTRNNFFLNSVLATAAKNVECFHVYFFLYKMYQAT